MMHLEHPLPPSQCCVIIYTTPYTRQAIKLTVNDMLRKSFAANGDHEASEIRLNLELFSGGCAGACQVLVTNPLEIM